MKMQKLNYYFSWISSLKIRFWTPLALVMYTFELVIYCRLFTASTVQCLASIFMLNNLNFLICIVDTSLNKAFYV